MVHLFSYHAFDTIYHANVLQKYLFVDWQIWRD